MGENGVSSGLAPPDFGKSIATYVAIPTPSIVQFYIKFKSDHQNYKIRASLICFNQVWINSANQIRFLFKSKIFSSPNRRQTLDRVFCKHKWF